NTVFQSYALFPHLSVEENVAFGLRYKDATKSETKERVGKALELVALTGFEKRRPNQLSGGQQQRVALARALILNPAVLLLEEPATAYVADFLGVSNLMDATADGMGEQHRCKIRLGESDLLAGAGEPDARGPVKITIRPERVQLEEQGTTGANRVPGMVERVV